MPCGFTHLFHGKSFFPIRFNISQHSRSPFSPKTSLDWSVVWLSHKAWITHEEQAAFPCPLCVSSHTESNSFQPKASIAQEWLANSCGSRPATGGGSQLWITILPTHRQPQPPHHFSLTRDTCMGHKSHPSPILWGHEQGEERDVGEKEQGRKELGWIGCWGGCLIGLASVVAMQKQSNTNWSHSRGTAGAHRDDSLGGPRVRGEREGVRLQEKWLRMKDREVENRGY